MSEKITDRQKNYTLFVLVLVFTSSHVDRQIMGILGQPIKESLLISDTQLGLLTGIMFAVFYATLGMPIAMLADRVNLRSDRVGDIHHAVVALRPDADVGER